MISENNKTLLSTSKKHSEALWLHDTTQYRHNIMSGLTEPTLLINGNNMQAMAETAPMLSVLNEDPPWGTVKFSSRSFKPPLCKWSLRQPQKEAGSSQATQPLGGQDDPSLLPGKTRKLGNKHTRQEALTRGMISVCQSNGCRS